MIASARDNGPAADTILADWFRTRRYAGSKDRRAIREHVYSVLRAFDSPPVSGRAAMIALFGDQPHLFDGSTYGAASISDGEVIGDPSIGSDWLATLVPAEMRQAASDRASLDVRVNALRAERDQVALLLDDVVPIENLPHGLRLPAGTAIEKHDAWLNGLVEIQDAGSQWVVEACRAQPGMTVVDLCAGAGGKSLALAAEMQGQGRLIASDTNRSRLSRLPPRAGRAGVTIVEARLLDAGREAEMLSDLAGAADLVLVDAPCMGSGTWRRNPESRWRMTPDRLERMCRAQRHVLEIGAGLVRRGGALVYAVCSVIDREGRDQISNFLDHNPGWKADNLNLPIGIAHGDGRLLTPYHDETDGFFIARMARS